MPATVLIADVTEIELARMGRPNRMGEQVYLRANGVARRACVCPVNVVPDPH